MGHDQRAGPARRGTIMRGLAIRVAAAGVMVAVLAGQGVPAAADERPRFTSTQRPAPGVLFRTFETAGARGPVLGYLLDVDLRSPGVRVGLLRPAKVAERRTVAEMARAQRAVAGVNGDFFDL